MKVNFENVIFKDECRATMDVLDGPDGWSRGWCDAQLPSPQRLYGASKVVGEICCGQESSIMK